MTENNSNQNIACNVFGKGPPIVVIHGFGVNSDWTRHIALHFADKYKVYLLDAPYSSKLKTNIKPCIEDYAKAIANFIKESKIEKPIVIGESMGSAVATVLDSMGLASKLVLISPFTQYKGCLLCDILKILIVPNSILAKKAVLKIFPFDKEKAEKAIRIISACPKSSLVKQLIAVKRFNGDKYFEGIKTKTLIIVGCFDKLFDFQDLLSKNQNISIYTENDSGHHVASTKWPVIGKIIEEFLS
jgi:pimeloyl-ACP methyl ester carboxylesterase